MRSLSGAIPAGAFRKCFLKMTSRTMVNVGFLPTISLKFSFIRKHLWMTYIKTTNLYFQEYVWMTASELEDFFPYYLSEVKLNFAWTSPNIYDAWTSPLTSKFIPSLSSPTTISFPFVPNHWILGGSDYNENSANYTSNGL